MPRGEKRVIWGPYKGSSKYPEKKPRRHFGSSISLLAFCLFWIGSHFTYLIIKVYRKYYIDILRMAQSEFNVSFILWYIAIPSYRDWTNPKTILQFILMIIFIFVISIIPGNYFHIEVSWFLINCVRWVRMSKCRWTGLTKLRNASSIHGSNFVIIEHERDVKRKGIRIMCFY